MPNHDSKVVIELLGGLGNQMFQYAAALALAKRVGGEVSMDLSLLNAVASRPYQLDKLQVPQQFEPSTGSAQPQGRLRRGVGRLKHLLPGHYSEPHFHFDPAFFKLRGHIIRLHGNFQSPRYFAGYEELIRQVFQPSVPLGTAGYAEQLSAEPANLSVHIRLGDYANNAATADTHGNLDAGYYRRALKLVMRMLGKPVPIYLFSDEPDTAAAKLNLPGEVTVMRTDPARPLEDMHLMSLCKHHIIANSTYSWWGAWLNPSPDKIVVAPRQWFAKPTQVRRNPMDIYPPDWITLA